MDKTYPDRNFVSATLICTQVQTHENNLLDVYWMVTGDQPDEDKMIVQYGPGINDFTVFTALELKNSKEETEKTAWVSQVLTVAREMSFFDCPVW